MTKLTVTVLAVSCLSGCVMNESGAKMGLFSATAPVFAILTDDLYTGTAIGYMDRTGSIELTSSLDSASKCVGEFHYTGSKTGVATVSCNDGNLAKLQFNALGPLSGYGVGRSTRGPASFTFGLTLEQASKYLTIPNGKRLIKKSNQPKLEVF